MGFWATAGAATQVLGGIKGLFGGSSGVKLPSEQVNGMAKGARLASKNFGFNPLTMLGVSGGALGVPGGSTPPLASTQAISEGLRGIDDQVSGDADRRRKADQAALELAQIEIDRAKAGILDDGSRTSRAAHAVSSAESTLGRRAVVASPVRGHTPALGEAGKFSQGENPVAPGRKEDISPLTNSPGVFELENRGTFGTVTIPGDGEPWGIDELATAVAFGLPQVGFNIGRKIGEHSIERTKEDKEKEDREAIRAAQENHPANPHRAPSTPYVNYRNRH